MKEGNDNLKDRIIVDPKILAGKPVVKGTRIPVYVILEAIEAGQTVEEIAENYPDLDEKDVKAAIRYATEIVEREKVRKREAVTQLKLLVDENIPPSVTEFLRKESHDVKAVRDFAMGADDESLIEVAIEEDRTLLTQDLDMGHIYYFSKREEVGIIVIRPRIQTVENLKEILENFLSDIEKRKVNKALFIVEESGYRIRKQLTSLLIYGALAVLLFLFQ